jgi:hypothetical protein
LGKELDEKMAWSFSFPIASQINLPQPQGQGKADVYIGTEYTKFTFRFNEGCPHFCTHFGDYNHEIISSLDGVFDSVAHLSVAHLGVPHLGVPHY